MAKPSCHVAYCVYAATGEGSTIVLAVGGSARHAEKIFKQRTDEFFHVDMEIVPLDDTERIGIEAVTKMIPPYALTELLTNPPGTTEYYSHLHFNLA